MASPGNPNQQKQQQLQQQTSPFDLQKLFKGTTTTTTPPSITNPSTPLNSSPSFPSPSPSTPPPSSYPTPSSSYPPPTGTYPYHYLPFPTLQQHQEQQQQQQQHPLILHHPPQMHSPQKPIFQPPSSSSPSSPNNPNTTSGARLMALLSTQNQNPPLSPSPSSPVVSEFTTMPSASSPQCGTTPPTRMLSSKVPKGRHLKGEQYVSYDIDVRLAGEVQPQLEVTPITKYASDPGLVLGRQIAVNRSYICYGLKLGAIRVLNIITALRYLLRGHTQVGCVCCLWWPQLNSILILIFHDSLECS